MFSEFAQHLKRLNENGTCIYIKLISSQTAKLNGKKSHLPPWNSKHLLLPWILCSEKFFNWPVKLALLFECMLMHVIDKLCFEDIVSSKIIEVSKNDIS